MPADPHQRDEAITAAVIDLLRTKGPKAVNVEAVAEHAGVAKTTIYRRYRDREEMIAAALTLLTSPPPPPDGSARQPMLQWVIEQSFNAIESGIGLGGVAALLTDDDTSFTALIRALLVEHRAALATVVEDAQRPDSCEQTSTSTLCWTAPSAPTSPSEHAAETFNPTGHTNPPSTMACCCRLSLNREPPSSGVSKSPSVIGRVGDRPAARRVFEESLALLDGLPLHYDRARSQLRLRPDAAPGLQAAGGGRGHQHRGDLYLSLGAHTYVQRCERELKAGGLHPVRGPRVRSSSRPFTDDNCSIAATRLSCALAGHLLAAAGSSRGPRHDATRRWHC